MIEPTTEALRPVDHLNKTFMLDFPGDAARQLATMPPQEAALAIQELQPQILARVFEKISPSIAHVILNELQDEQSVAIISNLNASISTQVLSQFEEDRKNHYLSLLNPAIAEELKTLLEYPDDSAGRLMQTKFIAFDKNTTVDQAIAQLKQRKTLSLYHLYLLNDELRLHGLVDIQRLALADGDQKLASLSLPVKVFVEVLDTKETVVEKLKKHRIDALPVIDYDQRLVGTIEGQGLIEALREDIATDLQTMVGVSKDERALSSSWFAVKKRLPWLQINLLTAFLAAAVVGAFEATIAKYTALAILLPIAAGQSGNTGAQALAVTMRGLTLREITIKHWLRITLKELGAGLINGVATAITCGLGVYIWSKSLGLSLIIALAMISSMTIAGISGALVPIGLKKIGQDPALSSSIILTTITDIAGFLSFLGIATSLAFMLEAG